MERSLNDFLILERMFLCAATRKLLCKYEIFETEIIEQYQWLKFSNDYESCGIFLEESLHQK